jgi:hypothetical protein
VALTDGDDALQRQVRNRLSTFTLVLDIIHASEYLWDAANALLGETNPDRTAWVREHLLHILSGKTADVIQTLESYAQEPSLSASQREALNTTMGYYRRNLPYMRYDQYLAQGWPIGTGVVEGACGHLSRTGWSNPACVGQNQVHRPFWTCEQFASTMTGMITNVFAGSTNAFMDLSLPFRQRPRLLC